MLSKYFANKTYPFSIAALVSWFPLSSLYCSGLCLLLLFCRPPEGRECGHKYWSVGPSGQFVHKTKLMLHKLFGEFWMCFAEV